LSVTVESEARPTCSTGTATSIARYTKLTRKTWKGNQDTSDDTFSKRNLEK
jgi:hypothetical protein